MKETEYIEIVEQALNHCLPDFAVQKEVRLDEEGTGLFLEHEDRRLVMEIKAVSSFGIQDLIARLSVASMIARHFAKGHKAVPVAVVVTMRVGPKALQKAGEFMHRYAPDVGWCVIDLRGKLHMRIASLDIELRDCIFEEPPPRVPRQERLSFSDLNRWLLKILLLGELDEVVWAGPRESVITANQFRRIADVSTDKVYRFLRMFEARGFLRRNIRGIRLVRVRELLESLLADETLKPSVRIPVRSLTGKKQFMKKLVAPQGEAGVLGGFSACRVLGVGHSLVEDLDEIHVRGPEQAFIRRFDLEACDERDAQCRLLVSRHTESIFRGAVQAEGLAVVDLLQAALDVLGHAAGGREQAEFIVDKILHEREQAK